MKSLSNTPQIGLPLARALQHHATLMEARAQVDCKLEDARLRTNTFSRISKNCRWTIRSRKELMEAQAHVNRLRHRESERIRRLEKERRQLLHLINIAEEVLQEYRDEIEENLSFWEYGGVGGDLP